MNSYSGHTYKFTKAVSDGGYQMLVSLTKAMSRMARLNMPKSMLKRSKEYRVLPAKKLPRLPERTLTI